MADHTLTMAGADQLQVVDALYLELHTAVEMVLAEVALRLANITRANGYYTTVIKIEEARLESFKENDLPTINYWLLNLESAREVYDEDSREFTLFVEIHDTTRDETFIKIAGRLAADVTTALARSDASPAVSDSVDIELGESVSDFVFNGFDYEIGEGQKPWCGALCRFTIKFKTDPFDMVNYGTG